MTDRTKKITELSAINAASSDDVLIVVDSPSSNGATRKITVGNLFGNITSNVSTSKHVSISNTLSVSGAVDIGAVYVGGNLVVNSSGNWVGSSSGIKGEKGQKGDTGDKGEVGAKGELGITGDKGQKGEVGITVTLTSPQVGDLFFYNGSELVNWQGDSHYNISSVLASSRQYELTRSVSNTILVDDAVDNEIYTVSGLTISFNLISAPTGQGYKIGNSTYGVTGVNTGETLRHVSPAGVISYGANAQNKNSGTLYFNIPHETNGVYKIFTTDETKYVYIYIKNIQNI